MLTCLTACFFNDHLNVGITLASHLSFGDARSRVSFFAQMAVKKVPEKGESTYQNLGEVMGSLSNTIDGNQQKAKFTLVNRSFCAISFNLVLCVSLITTSQVFPQNAL